MLEAKNAEKTSDAPTPDSSSEWKGDVIFLDKDENERKRGKKKRVEKRFCRKCNTVLRAGNEDTLCSACQDKEKFRVIRPYVPRDPNQKF